MNHIFAYRPFDWFMKACYWFYLFINIDMYFFFKFLDFFLHIYSSYPKTIHFRIECYSLIFLLICIVFFCHTQEYFTFPKNLTCKAWLGGGITAIRRLLKGPSLVRPKRKTAWAGDAAIRNDARYPMLTHDPQHDPVARQYIRRETYILYVRVRYIRVFYGSLIIDCELGSNK